MAIARPVRALGLAAILMWCFFLWTIWRPAAPLGPGDSLKNLERDPNLDRKHHPPQFTIAIRVPYSQRLQLRANPKAN